MTDQTTKKEKTKMPLSTPEMKLSKQKGFWWAWLGGQIITLLVPPICTALFGVHLAQYVGVVMTLALFILTYVSYKSVQKNKSKGRYRMLVAATMASLSIVAGSVQLLLFNDKLGKDSFKWYFPVFIFMNILWLVLAGGLIIHFGLAKLV